VGFKYFRDSGYILSVLNLCFSALFFSNSGRHSANGSTESSQLLFISGIFFPSGYLFLLCPSCIKRNIIKMGPVSRILDGLIFFQITSSTNSSDRTLLIKAIPQRDGLEMLFRLHLSYWTPWWFLRHSWYLTLMVICAVWDYTIRAELKGMTGSSKCSLTH